jgi:hypothetical protein
MNNGIYGLATNSLTGASTFSRNGVAAPVSVRALIVAGGGAGGAFSGGGYSAVPGGGGGGGGVIDTTVAVALNTAYAVTVGAGSGLGIYAIGSPSRFGVLQSVGGGTFFVFSSIPFVTFGGSTAGGQNSGAFSPSVLGQGNIGGTGGTTSAGGGGGAGGAGGTGTNGAAGGTGGAGLRSTVPLIPTTYSGGGGGASAAGAGTASDGGGAGAAGSGNGTAGTANRGGGGGGGAASSGNGGNGGSGVVILRFNSALLLTASVGLTYTTQFSGSDAIVTFTGGTGTVTFS